MFRFLFSVLIGGMTFCSVYAQEESHIVINEIYYKNTDNRPIEYIEIYNAHSNTINLANWTISGAIRYEFPPNTFIAPNEYLIITQDDQFWLDTLGHQIRVLGNYKGNLSSSEETLKLYNNQKDLVDEITYQQGFPYPTIYNTSAQQSIQLLHPELSNQFAGHWRKAAISPGKRNTNVYLADANAPPAIEQVQHSPQSPVSNVPITITAHIHDANDIAQVQVLLQIVKPGEYIRKSDSDYEKLTYWIPIPMYDDGNHGDISAKDGIYTAVIPDSIQKHRHLYRYRIWAKDKTGKQVRVPYDDDPQPNFAYFVYDELPDYCGYSFDSLPSIPVYHLIADEKDVDFFIGRYSGTMYPTTGTLVYNGQVFDHIGYRSRGFKNRHKRTKRNLKINLNTGHPLAVTDDYGIPYEVTRDKIVLSGTCLLDRPNTYGLAESVLYRLFNLQNAPASNSDYIHFRVIDNVEESDTTQGDFWGIYLMLENYDDDFLKMHDLPDGNMYSYKPFKLRHERKNEVIADRKIAYNEWDSGHDKPHDLDWWENHLDIEAFCAFIIGNQAINNRETGYRGQHWWVEYQNPKTGHWYVFPWDLDKSWAVSKGYGTIASSIRKAAFQHDSIQICYENQLRSFLDLLYNEEQMAKLINEEASHIYDPNKGFSFPDLDALRWGTENKAFVNEIGYLNRFVQRRRTYILEEILPNNCPPKPVAEFSGQGNFIATQLQFNIQNDQQYDREAIVGMQWRIAEVSTDDTDVYHPRLPDIYEITPIWESELNSDLEQTITIPQGLAIPHHNYRVRVRIMDTTGRYSHWSEPIEFVPTFPELLTPNDLRINEVLYHSNDICMAEFIEIHNPTDRRMNLKYFGVAGAIDYTFEEDIYIEPYGFITLSESKKQYKKQYGEKPFDKYDKQLSNSSETIALLDPLGRIIDTLTYMDTPPWDSLADGYGYSLEWIGMMSDTTVWDNWKASACDCGTPNNPNQIVDIPAIKNTVEIEEEKDVQPKSKLTIPIYLFLLSLGLFSQPPSKNKKQET